jgi:hypothetical protein
MSNRFRCDVQEGVLPLNSTDLSIGIANRSYSGIPVEMDNKKGMHLRTSLLNPASPLLFGFRPFP